MLNQLKKNNLFKLIFMITSLTAQDISVSLFYGDTSSYILNKHFKGLMTKNEVSFQVDYKKEFKNSKFYLNPIFSNNKVIFNEAYFTYSKNDINFLFGRFDRSFSSENTSINSGSMMESGNALSPTRLGFEYLKNFNSINVSASMFHGNWYKNEIITSTPFLHQKSLYVSKKTKKQIFQVGLSHSALWSGKNKFGKQPTSFDDFLNIFTGQPGENDATIGDQINALGEHYGMWDFSINFKISNSDYFKIYYHYFFEDSSGLKLENNLNNYDGLKGLELGINNMIILFEHLKTTNQGGSIHPPGLDSYYNSKAYPPGWIYNNQNIGNSLLRPDNNRKEGFHFSIRTDISFLKDFTISYVDLKEYIPFTDPLKDYSLLLENDNGKDYNEFSTYFTIPFFKKNKIKLYLSKNNLEKISFAVLLKQDF